MTEPSRTDGTPQDDLSGIAALFRDITSMLANQSGRVDSDKAVRLAAELILHSEHCGITLIRAKAPPRTIASTDKLPEAVDALQYRLHQGPCLDAADSAAVIRTDDLAEDRRW